MDDNRKQGVFFGGIPTSIDVKKITDALGVPTKGALVRYSRLEEILGIGRKESRFLSVVGAWRNLLRREHNLITEGVKCEGIMVCEDGRRVDHSIRGTVKGVRMIRKAYGELAVAPRDGLSQEKVRQLDHGLSITGSLLSLAHQLGKSPVLGPSVPILEK